eukprot:363074-Chlamydomonas_euryale.AAC.12
MKVDGDGVICVEEKCDHVETDQHLQCGDWNVRRPSLPISLSLSYLCAPFARRNCAMGKQRGWGAGRCRELHAQMHACMQA